MLKSQINQLQNLLDIGNLDVIWFSLTTSEYFFTIKLEQVYYEMNLF